MSYTFNQLAPLLFALLIAALQIKMPQLTRPEIYFSVTVAPDFRSTNLGREVARRYVYGVAWHSAVALALLGYAVYSRTAWLVLVGLCWQLVGPMTSLVSARTRVLPHRTPQTQVREASLASRKPARGSLWLQAGPFAILGGALWWTAQRGPQADATPQAPSLVGMYGALTIGIGLCAVILVLRHVLPRAARWGGDELRVPSAQRFRSWTTRVLEWVNYFVAVSFAIIVFARSGHNVAFMSQVLNATALGFVLMTFVLYAKTGQGGSRVMPIDRTHAPQGDLTDDAHWKLGLFYCNANDPALFVEKRFGIGHTVNLANRWSWLILAAIVALVAGALSLRFCTAQ